MFASILVEQSLIGRACVGAREPVCAAHGEGQPEPRQHGHGAAGRLGDGARRSMTAVVLADLGVMTASEAARVADAVNASGAGRVVAVAVGAM